MSREWSIELWNYMKEGVVCVVSSACYSVSVGWGLEGGGMGGSEKMADAMFS